MMYKLWVRHSHHCMSQPSHNPKLLEFFGCLSLKRHRYFRGRIPNGIEGYKHPQHIEEDEIDPEVHKIAGIEVEVAG